MQIFLYGQLAEAAGQKRVEIQDKQNSSDLIQLLEQRFPELREFDYVMAVNRDIVEEDCELDPNDEIALLPPYAGG